MLHLVWDSTIIYMYVLLLVGFCSVKKQKKNKQTHMHLHLNIIVNPICTNTHVLSLMLIAKRRQDTQFSLYLSIYIVDRSQAETFRFTNKCQ